MATGFVSTVKSVLGRWFPERQFYHRSHGEVRFISLSARNQIGLAVVSFAFLAWVAYATVNVVFKEQIINSKQKQLQATKIEYEVKMSEMQSAYDELNAVLALAQERFEETTKELEAKHGQLQTFINRQAATQADFEEVRERLGKLADASDSEKKRSIQLMQVTDLEPARRVSRMGVNDQDANITYVAQVMRAVSNGRLTLHQDTAEVSDRVTKLDERVTQINRSRSEEMALVEERTSRAIEQFESYIETTGLNLDSVLSKFNPSETAVGGPLIALQGFDGSEEQVEKLDDFQRQVYRIDLKLDHMATLEAALSAMPLALPTSQMTRFSSPYGPRRDPFTRKAAFHSGLDIVGPRRSEVHVTAAGKVTFAGTKGAYGRMVQVDHGHGFRTRYGHLYKILVKKGDTIEFGDTVGLLGSSGRASGPHIHYEVWFDGKTRDPKNFVKAGRHVLKS